MSKIKTKLTWLVLLMSSLTTSAFATIDPITGKEVDEATAQRGAEISRAVFQIGDLRHTILSKLDSNSMGRSACVSHGFQNTVTSMKRYQVL